MEFVKKWSATDSSFIDRGDKRLEIVREWTWKLFHDDFEGERLIDEEMLAWFMEVVFGMYSRAENEREKKLIMKKIIHTRDVVCAGREIAEAEKSYQWNFYQVDAVCLLHDIARFEQALLQSFSDEKTGFDHATVGAKMIVEHEFSCFDVLEVDKQSVVEAVRYHSGWEYRGENNYAKLVRDADKLALLRELAKLFAMETKEFVEKGYTEEALREYRAGGMVRRKNIISKADVLLAWLAWESDLNFVETKRVFVEEGIKDWMKIELRKLGVEV